MRIVNSSAAALLLIVSVAGCGYHPVGGTIAGTHPATVRVPVFTNRSFRPVVDALLTNAVIHEISGRRGAWRLGDDEAEYLLAGTVLTYGAESVAFSAADRVLAYRISVSVELTLQKKGGEVVWKRILTEAVDYPANAVVAVQQNSEDAAVRDLCGKIARQVSVLLLENF
jgi:outer membrane lipopolysaccharide assembly protein LptE/RlpB